MKTKNDWNDCLPIFEPWDKWIASQGIELRIVEDQPPQDGGVLLQPQEAYFGDILVARKSDHIEHEGTYSPEALQRAKALQARSGTASSENKGVTSKLRSTEQPKSAKTSKSKENHGDN